MAHVREILRYIGEDPQRDGLLDTPARVVKAMGEDRKASCRERVCQYV